MKGYPNAHLLVTPAALAKMLEGAGATPPLVLDTRAPEHYTAGHIPGAIHIDLWGVSLIDTDQPVLVPIGGEIRHQAEPCALIAAPDRATLREAKRHVNLRTERLPAIFDPLESDREFARYTIEHGAAAVVIEGTYRVGHQEQLYIENQAMIAVPDAVGPLDHDRGAVHRRRGVTVLDRVASELPIRLERIEDRREPLGAEGDVPLRLPEGGPIRRGDERARLRLVPDLAADRHEHRLVGVDEADDVVARDVVGRDDDDALPVEGVVEDEADEACMWLRRPDRRAEPGPREDEVVGIPRLAGQLRRALAPERQVRAGATRRLGARIDDERRGLREGQSGRNRAGR